MEQIQSKISDIVDTYVTELVEKYLVAISDKYDLDLDELKELVNDLPTKNLPKRLYDLYTCMNIRRAPMFLQREKVLEKNVVTHQRLDA